jgi:hypothetical protein
VVIGAQCSVGWIRDEMYPTVAVQVRRSSAAMSMHIAIITIITAVNHSSTACYDTELHNICSAAIV